MRPPRATACGQRGGVGRAWPRIARHRPALRWAGGEVPAPRERGRAELGCWGARLALGTTMHRGPGLQTPPVGAAGGRQGAQVECWHLGLSVLMVFVN